MSAFKTFTFGDFTSSEANCYMVNPPSFRTAVRDVSEVVIPARSGSLFYDNGRFENVEVTLPVVIVGDFATNYIKLKNFMMSQYGYQRLETEWDSMTYRQAVMVDGIAPELTTPDGSGEFNITLSAKPQVFLKSGEEPVEINITNGSSQPFDFFIYENLSDFIKSDIKKLGCKKSEYYIEITLPEDCDFVSLTEATYENAYIKRGEHDSTGSGSGDGTLVKYATGQDLVSGSKICFELVSPFMSVSNQNGVIWSTPRYETTINNRTMFDAEPIIVLDMDDFYQTSEYHPSVISPDIYFGYPDNNVELSFGFNSKYITSVESGQPITYDSHTGLCTSKNKYNGRPTNHNDGVSESGKQLVIPRGTSKFYVSDFIRYKDFEYINGVSIIPRWWTL